MLRDIILKPFFENCSQIRDLSFLRYCKNLLFLGIAKTNIDRQLISDMYLSNRFMKVFDTEGTIPIHKAINSELKQKSRVMKILRKTVKPEDI